MTTKKLSEETEQNPSETQDKQIYMTTKKLSEETEQNPSEPQPH